MFIDNEMLGCDATATQPTKLQNLKVVKIMSPTVLREDGFRFYFFSREEPRMHVHVQSQNGEAKFWLEPKIELAKQIGLSQREIKAALNLVKEYHPF